MQKRFFDHLAAHLVQSNAGDLSQLVIVLPSKRSRLYLTDALKREIGSGFWLPTFMVFPELLQWLSGERIASSMEQMIMLYEAHRLSNAHAESFDSFSSWASLALRDFSDIDASLAHTPSLFADLRNIREIDKWSFNQEKLDDAHLDYLKFWKELHELYSAFSSAQMQKSAWTYSGLVRHCAEPSIKFVQDLRDSKFSFAGLAGFSNAETELIQKISTIAACEVISDLDRYYVENPFQEAGYFARRSGADKWVFDNIRLSSAKVEIFQCSSSVAEAMAVGGHLRQMSLSDLQDSAVILADEAMLDVFLTCLPELPCPLNLAIGIPVQATIPGKWIKILFKIRAARNKKRGVYHADLNEYLYHVSMAGLATEACNGILQEMVSDGHVYASNKALRSWAEKFPELAKILRLIDAECDWSECLTEMVKIDFPFDSTYELHPLAWHSLKDVVNEVATIVSENNHLQDEETIDSLMQSFCAREKLHYKGEPLRGLQVLSLAETRAIDFKNIFILGANDHEFPGNSHEQSLIPLELRAHFKLAMPEQKEAHIAYNFYRLLQRSEQIRIYYSAVSKDLRSSEQSRYISQIMDEWPAYAKGVQINKGRIQLDAMSSKEAIRPVMNDFAIKRLDELLSYGISPSAINKFNNCPQDFYYRYILGLGEEEKLEESLSAAEFGTIVHHVMEHFYRPFIGSYPELLDYENAMDTLDFRINEALNETFRQTGTITGYNRLAMKVAKSMLLDLLKFERLELEHRKSQSLSSKIIDLEVALKREVDGRKFGWTKPIRVRGKLDRVEEVDGVIRIIDYKTGKLDGERFDLGAMLGKGGLDSSKYEKQLQLLIYLFLYEPRLSEHQCMTAGLFGLQNIDLGYQYLVLDGSELFRAVAPLFEEAFVEWVKNVYSMDGFVHESDSKFCSYCIPV